MESEQNNQASNTDATTQTSTPAAAPAPTSAPAHDGNSNRMLMGILAYFGILVIIPYMVAKDDAFVKFHVKQGIVLAAIWLAFWVAGMFVWALYPIIGIANLALLVLSIIGIINVVQNKETELPVVGSLAKHVKI